MLSSDELVFLRTGGFANSRLPQRFSAPALSGCLVYTAIQDTFHSNPPRPASPLVGYIPFPVKELADTASGWLKFFMLRLLSFADRSG